MSTSTSPAKYPVESHADAVKELLGRFTGNDFRAPGDLVQIHASATVEEALEILTKANKAAAPVYDEVVDEVRTFYDLIECLCVWFVLTAVLPGRTHTWVLTVLT